MSAFRYSIVIFTFSVLVLFLGFGCATKSEKNKASMPAPPPVRLPTNPPAPAVVTTAPVYVPNISHADGPLPDGILAWDSTSKETNVTAMAATAEFAFDFTNVSSGKVSILNVHPSCGCTTAKLPPLPWTLAPGMNGQIGATVNIEGKTGTLFKTLSVKTDKGLKTLMLKIVIAPLVFTNVSEMERERFQQIAKVDRQAVFHGDCASCHVRLGEGKYGKALYDADCAICHEANPRATMVPNLHALKTPTNVEFWRTWIAHGKPGSLMPAFSTDDGGPLNDMQIVSLADYLNLTIPSHVASPQ